MVIIMRPTRTEPAYSLLYEPSQLAPVSNPPDTRALLTQIEMSLKSPFNDRQAEAFGRSFTERVSLLWGPPGTGKTTVLAGIVLGWLENAWLNNTPISIGVGSSNYNAIDNVLQEIVELLERRKKRIGEFPLGVNILRVRSNLAKPLDDDTIMDIERNSEAASTLAEMVETSTECLIVGGTWMQLGKMAETISEKSSPVASWFDLFLIDEASQVKVSFAAPYFLLLKEAANIVIAGDHKQLGPIYNFQTEEDGQGLFDCIFTYMKEANGIQPVALEKNYRTNTEISSWPKERFYSEGYEAFYPKRRLNLTLPNLDSGRPLNWPEKLPWNSNYLRILDPDLPVVVITYDLQGYTLSNPFEAQTAAALSYFYRSLLLQNGRRITDIEVWTELLGIVTPHRAQMSNIRNCLAEAAGLPRNPSPFVDTVDRFQGQERDLIIASYAVSDKDFVKSEDEFILNSRRFNVTLTRARSKFIMFVSDSIVQHLPSDSQVASQAAHLQLFVENYCSLIDEISLPFFDNGNLLNLKCRLRGRRDIP